MTTAQLLKEIEKLVLSDGDTTYHAWELRKGGDVEAVGLVAKHLASKKAEVRAKAAITLGQMGDMAAPAVPAIAKLIADKDEDVRRCVVCAIGMIGPRAAPGIPALIEGLRDKDEEVRRQAALSLGDIGEDSSMARSALPELCAMYGKEPDWMARWNIVTGIIGLGGDATTLELALEDEDETVRKEAARGLKLVKKKTASTEAALVKSIKANQATIAKTIEQFGGEDKLDDLGGEIVDELRTQNIHSAVGLAKFRAQANVARPILEEAIESGELEDELHEEVSAALEKLGAATPPLKTTAKPSKAATTAKPAKPTKPAKRRR